MKKSKGGGGGGGKNKRRYKKKCREKIKDKGKVFIKRKWKRSYGNRKRKHDADDNRLR